MKPKKKPWSKENRILVTLGAKCFSFFSLLFLMESRRFVFNEGEFTVNVENEREDLISRPERIYFRG